jgi:predicted flap endonuclease-1-like 5' DNA nuclease
VSVVTPEEAAKIAAAPAKATPTPKVKKPKAPVVKKVAAPKAKAKIAPKKVAKATTTDGDDLTKIEGIGTKIQEVFYTAGIKTYTDLSASKIGDLRTILADNKLSQHEPKTWKKQATLAKNGKWDALKELQDELN